MKPGNEKKCPNMSNVINIDFAKKSLKIAPDKNLNAEKRQAFDDWLSHGIVLLTFDTKCEGVEIPQEFIAQDILSLNFSHDFAIADFNFNEHSVWATLSFDSGEHFCRVPWQAVISMSSPFLQQSLTWQRNKV